MRVPFSILIASSISFTIFSVYGSGLTKNWEEGITKGRYWHFVENLSTTSDTADLRLWIALPVEHRGQEVNISEIYPEPAEIVEDSLSGNRIIFWRYTDIKDENQIYFYYDFEFKREAVITNVDPEKIGVYDVESAEYLRYTQSEPWIEINDEIRTKAVDLVGEETNPYYQARIIFDWVIENMTYEYPDPINRGAARSFLTRKGDCGEFSAVFCAMCRSLGIPARTVTCMWLTDAGHQWAEILLPGYGWVPVDPSTAQGLAGKSKAFADEDRTRAFAQSRGISEYDPYWLFGNLYPERLIICVGNNIEVNHPGLGISKTFRFLQPGGLFAMPPSFEALGFSESLVQTGFFVFGDKSTALEFAQQEATKKMVPGYLYVGDYEKAEKGLKMKLDESPEDAQALLDLGRCYVNQHRFDDAIETLQKSLSGKGGSAKPVMDVWAHNLLGVCFTEKGEFMKAREHFEKVIESGIDFQHSQQFAHDHLKELKNK